MSLSENVVSQIPDGKFWATAKEWADWHSEDEEAVKLQMVRRQRIVHNPSGKKGGKLYINVIAERARAKADAIKQLAAIGIDATGLV